MCSGIVPLKTALKKSVANGEDGWLATLLNGK
jgi:hypothetical protein